MQLHQKYKPHCLSEAMLWQLPVSDTDRRTGCLLFPTTVSASHPVFVRTLRDSLSEGQLPSLLSLRPVLPSSDFLLLYL